MDSESNSEGGMSETNDISIHEEALDQDENIALQNDEDVDSDGAEVEVESEMMYQDNGKSVEVYAEEHFKMIDDTKPFSAPGQEKEDKHEHQSGHTPQRATGLVSSPEPPLHYVSSLTSNGPAESIMLNKETVCAGSSKCSSHFYTPYPSLFR
jgi:hypothetical protein